MLRGTRHDDTIILQDRSQTVRALAGDDFVQGGSGHDVLYGDAGNDILVGNGDDVVRGGRGDDHVSTEYGEAYGSWGNDTVQSSLFAAGGDGDDYVFGTGQLYGDDGPGGNPLATGNDWLSCPLSPATYTQATGGGGADLFQTTSAADGVGAVLEITDFQHGEDQLLIVSLDPGDASSGSLATFQKLDANHNGVLEWSDCLGADGDPNTPDGSAVYSDGQTVWIGLHATVAGGTFNDAEDWIIVRNAGGQLAASDFILT